MKKTILNISVGLFAAIILLSGFYAFADDSTQTLLNPFSVVSGFIKARSATNGLQIPSLASSNNCVKTDASGKFGTTTCGSGGGGSSATTTISGVQGPNFTLQGTTNQVNVATSSGTITLSLPQDIATASSPQFAKIKTAVIFPASDSVQGVQINKADGTTNILNVDTTNGRVGIGTTSPSQLLTVGNNNQFTADASGNLTVTSGGSITVSSSNNNGAKITSSEFRFGLNSIIGFSTNIGVSPDANLSRITAGTIGVGTGAAGSIAGMLDAGKISIGTTTTTTTLTLQGTAGTDLVDFSSSTGSSLFHITQAGNVGIATTSPNATLDVNGSNAFRYIISNASTYTVATSTDNIIYMATTTVASTVNLPACVGSVDQVIYTVKDKGGNAGTNNITVTATAGGTIDGAATKVINSNYGSTKVQCVSSGAWFILP